MDFQVGHQSQRMQEAGARLSLGALALKNQSIEKMTGITETATPVTCVREGKKLFGVMIRQFGHVYTVEA